VAEMVDLGLNSERILEICQYSLKLWGYETRQPKS